MKKLLSPWMALITLVLMIAIRIADPSFVESVRLRYFDQLITSKGTTVSEQVHVVNIDDAYLRQKGQFPFPRGQYAELVANLYSHGAGLVVFNIYMPESDRFGQDNVLAQLMKEVPVVLPHTATNDSFLTDSHRPFRPGVSVIGGDPQTTGVRYGNIQPNIKQFNSNAAGVGVVNTLPEVDGVTRRIPMVVRANGQCTQVLVWTHCELPVEIPLSKSKWMKEESKQSEFLNLEKSKPMKSVEFGLTGPVNQLNIPQQTYQKTSLEKLSSSDLQQKVSIILWQVQSEQSIRIIFKQQF